MQDERQPNGREIREFLTVFIDLYRQHRHGARYVVKRPKDPALVKYLLTQFEPAHLERLAVELLTTKEPWIAGTDRGLGILAVKASWLDGVLCERAAQEPRRSWRMDCQHDPPCQSYDWHCVMVAREGGEAV